MPERATVFEVSQIGPETTPGTIVAATRRLQSLKIVPKIETKTTPFKPNGYKYDSILSVDQEWTSAKVDGVADYNQLIYPLAGLFGVVTPAVPAGGTLTQQWVFNPSTNNPETAKTFSVESGSSARAGKFGYGLFTDWGMTYTRADVKVTGALMGQRYVDGVTMTAAPTEVQTLTASAPLTAGTFSATANGQTASGIVYNATAAQIVTALTALSTIGTGGVTATGGPINAVGTPVLVTFAGNNANKSQSLITINSTGLTGGTIGVTETTAGGFDIVAQPIFPTQQTIYVDSSAAALGTTALTRPFSFNWDLKGKWGPEWPINAAFTSFPVHVELAPKQSMKLLVAADAAGMGYLTNFRAGSSMFIRCSSVGATIETSLTYLYNADFCGKITGISDFKDEKGIYAIEYSLDVMHDNVWGQSQSHLVQTKQSTL